MPHTEVEVFIFDRDEKEKLQYALSTFAQANGIPDQRFKIARSQHGKPYVLQENRVHFSISHSGDFWGCAVSSDPIGFDLEKVRDVNDIEIARHFFHSNEIRYVVQNRGDAFFAIWTAKESYIKYTGEGMTEAFGKFSVLESSQSTTFGPVNGVSLYPFPLREGYRSCICGKQIHSVLIVDRTQTGRKNISNIQMNFEGEN